MAAPKSARDHRTGYRVVKKNVAQGHACIKSTFNGTTVFIADPKDVVILWASSGHVGFKGSRESTSSIAQMTAGNATRKAMDYGMRKVDVFAKGPGSGHEIAIRSLQAASFKVSSVSDAIPQSHNGRRPPKRHRV